MKILTSEIDESVNFVRDVNDGGFFESRYVRREDGYFTLYLSSHSGCVKACRFCHLTQTGQTSYTHADLESYMGQAVPVLDHLEGVRGGAECVYFSFMARGEPLANRTLLLRGDEVLGTLGSEAARRGLSSRFCISSIMPVEMRGRELTQVFRYVRPMIYYSLYSLDPAFRAKWLPQAIDPALALAKLKRYQDETGMLVKIHGAIIENENDSRENWTQIVDAVGKIGLNVEYNLVEYNPHSEAMGRPGSTDLVYDYLIGLGQRANRKKRVGLDVKASCGMFVSR